MQSSIADSYVSALATRADKLPVGDPVSGQVALGPVIDAGQRDKIHELVTSSVAAGGSRCRHGSQSTSWSSSAGGSIQ